MKKIISNVMIVIVIVIALFLVVGGLVVNSSEAEPGGYSHLTENNEIDIAGYFDIEGASMQIKEESLDFVLAGSEAQFTFDKPLDSDNFRFYFAGVADNTLKKIEVTLTDVEHPEQAVTLVYSEINDVTTSVKQLDSKSSFVLTGGINAENTSDFSVNYDAEGKTFGDGLMYRITVRNNQEGSPFSGFSSHKVMLKVRLYGEQGSIFRVKQISNQLMGSYYQLADTEGPNITVINPLSEAMIDSIVTIPQAMAMDVLADTAIVTMKVTDPDGNEIKALDGTVLTDVAANKDYRIEIEKYGKYLVVYQATDGTNKSLPYQMMISVVDRKVPEISLKEQIPTLVRVGDTLLFPEVNYADNTTKAENIVSWITVKYPSGVIIEASKEVELQEEGVYEITFSAKDEAGNVGRFTVKTYAEEESHEK